jgi:hypothetical protein
MAEIIVKKGLEEVEFFGESDKKIDPETGEKRIVSEYPCWYFDTQIEEVNHQIERIKFNLENSELPERGIGPAKRELKKLEAMKERIDESTPQITNATKDELDKTRKELGKKIQEQMFTRSDEQKGIADAHDEYRRQSQPCIELSSNEMTLARKLNIRTQGNKVSRNDASRIWKIISKSIGENSDTEMLRK